MTDGGKSVEESSEGVFRVDKRGWMEMGVVLGIRRCGVDGDGSEQTEARESGRGWV
jgi:hypothetical protein